MQKWQYDMLGPRDKYPVDDLVIMGKQGWELVSVCVDSEGWWWFFFKRPLD